MKTINNTIINIVLSLCFIAMVGCDKKKDSAFGDGGFDVQKPTVTTASISNITKNSAKGGGEVISDGGSSVTSRGICWSTSSGPTINNYTATSGSGTGSFTATMNNLSSNTRYYVRAFATNSAGISYGSEYNFKTLNNIDQWLYYGAYANHEDCWGLTYGGTDEWAVRFPTSVLSNYSGASITKSFVYVGAPGTYKLKFYKGGVSSPNTLVHTKSFYASSEGWALITLNPLSLDVTTPLWVSVTFTYNAGVYPAGACAGVNNSDARWQNPNGNGWRDLYYYNNYRDMCWEIQVYVTNSTKGEPGEEILLPLTPTNIQDEESLRMSTNPNEEKNNYKPEL